MEKRFEAKNVASFDIDAEKCFTYECPNELPVKEGHLLGEELNAQAGFAQYRIGSKDAHSPQAVWVTSEPPKIATPLPEGLKGPNADLYWPVHGVPGTKGFELIEGLPKPTNYDYFVWKGVEPDLHPYGACYHDLENRLSTGVIEFLKSKDVHMVIVGGLAYDYCVGTTALQLLDANFIVFINEAACRGISPEGIQAMRKKLTANGCFFLNNASELKNFIY